MNVTAAEKAYADDLAYRQDFELMARNAEADTSILETFLAKCALTNGGCYDAFRHRRGENVRLIVV